LTIREGGAKFISKAIEIQDENLIQQMLRIAALQKDLHGFIFVFDNSSPALY
jgi:hypothetical protein